METTGKILYWFREARFNGDPSSICRCLEGCRELIPVYCFDSRIDNINKIEEQPFSESSMVAGLRDQLKLKGGNLLVVYNLY
jgi:deoxyribodipyrimidine photolyase